MMSTAYHIRGRLKCLTSGTGRAYFVHKYLGHIDLKELNEADMMNSLNTFKTIIKGV